MKTPNEMMDYFRSMPKREKTNPYWGFDAEAGRITIKYAKDCQQLLQSLDRSMDLLETVREYFRRVYESFQSEAQVLCVSLQDAVKLDALGLPGLPSEWLLEKFMVRIFVLPQVNTSANSTLSESFWQKYIVGQGIVPIARIHSHHVLDAYQSWTDYSTLNSNTLEIVIGHITSERMQVAFWLDEHGRDTKSFVFQATEHGTEGLTNVSLVRSGYGNK